MVAKSKAWVCGRSVAGIAGSILTEGADVHLLCFLNVVQVTTAATS